MKDDVSHLSSSCLGGDYQFRHSWNSGTASKSRHRISIESRAAWIERAAEIEEGDYGAGDDDDHGEEEDYGDDDDNCDDDDQ